MMSKTIETNESRVEIGYKKLLAIEVRQNQAKLHEIATPKPHLPFEFARTRDRVWNFCGTVVLTV